MDLSCRPNKANERFPFFLMPAEEIHETPAGDLSEDLRPAHHLPLLHPRRQQ